MAGRRRSHLLNHGPAAMEAAATAVTIVAALRISNRRLIACVNHNPATTSAIHLDQRPRARRTPATVVRVSVTRPIVTKTADCPERGSVFMASPTTPRTADIPRSDETASGAGTDGIRVA